MLGTRRVALIVLIGVAGSVLASCSSSSSSSSSNSGGVVSTPGLSASQEYVKIVAPVDEARALFKASKTAAELESRAGPFANALNLWSQELSAFKWPSAASADVQALVSAIPPLVADLRAVALGQISDVQKAETDGAPVTSGALAVRRDLGLSSS